LAISITLVEASDRFGPAEFNPFDAIFFEPAHSLARPEHVPQRVSAGRHPGAISNVAFADGHVASEKGTPAPERFDDGLRAR
jgi:prepilin-type processing-associated H-X9-DG protein